TFVGVETALGDAPRVAPSSQPWPRNTGLGFETESLRDSAFAAMVRRSPSRFRYEVFGNEFFVERHAQTGTVRHRRPAVVRLHPFVSEVVPHGGIIHRILKQEGVTTGAQPMQTGGHRDRTGVTMIAEARPDLFHAGADVGRVGETVAGQVDLVNVQRAAVE